MSQRVPVLSKLTLILLGSLSLARCSCEEEQFLPSADYDPRQVLDFGNVAVTTQKTLDVKVLSAGRAALILSDVSIEGDTEKFLLEVQPDLTSGLAPSRTSSITVTYRPCPDAWDGNRIREGYDLSGCPTSPDSATLVVTDNTRDQGVRITISGQPVQPPVVEPYCPNAVACGNTMPFFTECSRVQLGAVNAGDMPCDALIEIRNARRNDAPTGELIIERIEVLVQDFTERLDTPIIPGAEAGFSIRDLNGQELLVDTENPFVVPEPPVGSYGSNRFWVRFTGARRGTWNGDRQRMTGVRLYTNDPDNRVLTLGVSAIGSAPDLVVQPNFFDYGPVPQGQTRTATLTMINFGDSELRVSNLRIESGNSEFVFNTPKGVTPFSMAPNERAPLYLRYTPRDTGSDVEALTFDSNDPLEPQYSVTLRGGAIPTLDVDPADTLVFPLSDPPPPSRQETVRLQNIGYGELVINRLDIVGPGGDRMHESVDDFRIVSPAQCATLPCNLSLTLCSAQDTNCQTSQTSVVIEYRNNDISSVDLAELHIASNDPANPNHVLVLNAADVPCLFPSPAITVETPRACVGQPVVVNAMGSSAGGPPGGSTMITDYQWEWTFVARPPQPVFNPNGSVSTTFIPLNDGVHILGLRVGNSCGARSQNAATETILVAATCN